MKRLFVLFALYLALGASAAGGYFLTIRDGQICYRALDEPTYHTTGAHASALPCPQDRALLAQGLILPDRAGLTRALEDFCS